jgi:hypothetical protein
MTLASYSDGPPSPDRCRGTGGGGRAVNTRYSCLASTCFPLPICHEYLTNGCDSRLLLVYCAAITHTWQALRVSSGAASGIEVGKIGIVTMLTCC